MSAALGWVGALIGRLWAAFLGVITAILTWAGDLVLAALGLLVKLVGLLLTAAVAVLPPVPDLPQAGGLPSILGQANYFVPLDLAFQLLTVLGVVYGAIWLYKLGKFLRGGG